MRRWTAFPSGSSEPSPPTLRFDSTAPRRRPAMQRLLRYLLDAIPPKATPALVDFLHALAAEVDYLGKKNEDQKKLQKRRPPGIRCVYSSSLSRSPTQSTRPNARASDQQHSPENGYAAGHRRPPMAAACRILTTSNGGDSRARCVQHVPGRPDRRRDCESTCNLKAPRIQADPKKARTKGLADRSKEQATNKKTYQ